MLSGDDNENSQKRSVDLVSKITTLHMQHTFFVHFFAFVLHDYNEKLPGYKFYVLQFTFFWLPLIFTLVAASLSFFSPLL